MTGLEILSKHITLAIEREHKASLTQYILHAMQEIAEQSFDAGASYGFIQDYPDKQTYINETFN